MADNLVRESLTKQGWELNGRDREMDMDSYRHKKTGRQICVEDISDDFPVTLLIGELGQDEFGNIAHHLTPKLELLEVDSSWEGTPTTIVVAMTVEQVRMMFGRRAKIKRIQQREQLTSEPRAIGNRR